MIKKLGKIVRKRGDTYSFTIIVKKDGTYEDFTDFVSVTMSLNTLNAPSDSTLELFKLVGAFDSNRKTGRVTFTLTESQCNTLGDYYYEIQAIDADNKKRTYNIPVDISTQTPNNLFIFTQDINKE